MSVLREDIVAICRQFSLFERDAICCGTVSVPQCVLLQSLLEKSEDLSSLASAAGVTKGAMTRLVDGLETRGLVKRVPDENDGRRSFIRLTKAGLWEAKRLAKQTEEIVQMVFAAIPKKKRTQVAESISLLRIAMDSALRESCCD